MAFQLLDLEVAELSIVSEPANPFARVLLTKGEPLPPQDTRLRVRFEGRRRWGMGTMLLLDLPRCKGA